MSTKPSAEDVRTLVEWVDRVCDMPEVGLVVWPKVIVRELALAASRGEYEQAAVPVGAQEHCAWLHYSASNDGRTWIGVCDQDSNGAFKVYATPPASVPVGELEALLKRWPVEDFNTLYIGAIHDELRALIDQHEKVK